MKKPEKKECVAKDGKLTCFQKFQSPCPECYRNQACDEWEKYHKHIMEASNTCPIALLDKEYNQCQARQIIDNLPSEEEILSIIKPIDSRVHGGFVDEAKAKAIHKRIRWAIVLGCRG